MSGGKSAQLLELLGGEPELLEYPVEERWPNLAATVDGNRYGAAIRMSPAFVAAGLPYLSKSQL